jgi:hypothetical protein
MDLVEEEISLPLRGSAGRQDAGQSGRRRYPGKIDKFRI